MADQVKERPILFSGPMVRALLDGTKTQTRRVVKPQPYAAEAPAMKARVYRPGVAIFGVLADAAVGDEWVCPYGSAGERLWVRETWSTHSCFDDVRPANLTTRSFHYMADGACKTGKGRPSIHMPRFASRILLEITDVRVERLQDISEADALAEGVYDGTPCRCAQPLDFVRSCGTCGGRLVDAVGLYRALWDQINGAGAWDANPWVWAISFRRLKP